MRPETRSDGQITGETSIVGILRIAPKSKPTIFMAENEPQKRAWYWIDLPQLFLYTSPPVNRSFYIDAGIPSKSRPSNTNDLQYPLGGQTNISLRNQHLNYAITWFTLGVCLTFLSVKFVRTRNPASLLRSFK